jgi:hypothetical protein
MRKLKARDKRFKRLKRRSERYHIWKVKLAYEKWYGKKLEP